MTEKRFIKCPSCSKVMLVAQIDPTSVFRLEFVCARGRCHRRFTFSQNMGPDPEGRPEAIVTEYANRFSDVRPETAQERTSLDPSTGAP